jgi:AcrR family transcriptional regulator
VGPGRTGVVDQEVDAAQSCEGLRTVRSEPVGILRKARPRLFDEDDLLVAVRRRFNETGLHGRSVDELSWVTGLSGGSLHGAFGDKQALFQRVFEEHCSAALDASAAALLEGPEDEVFDRLRGWLSPPSEDVDRRGSLLAKATQARPRHVGGP